MEPSAVSTARDVTNCKTLVDALVAATDSCQTQYALSRLWPRLHRLNSQQLGTILLDILDRLPNAQLNFARSQLSVLLGAYGSSDETFRARVKAKFLGEESDICWANLLSGALRVHEETPVEYTAMLCLAAFKHGQPNSAVALCYDILNVVAANHLLLHALRNNSELKACLESLDPDSIGGLKELRSAMNADKPVVVLLDSLRQPPAE